MSLQRKLVEELDTKAFRVKFYGSPLRFKGRFSEEGSHTTTSTTELQKVPLRLLIGWLFSRRDIQTPSVDFESFPIPAHHMLAPQVVYGQILSLKYLMHYWIRESIRWSIMVDDLLLHIGIRGVFKSNSV
jgi:hypothetical protein